MENRKISKIIEEVNEVVSSMTPAKKYISGKKLNAKTQKALSDIEKNHNTSWAVEIFRRNQENLDLISLLYRGNKISYEKMFTEAYDYAKSLKSIGYTKGDTIPICVDNIPEYLYGDGINLKKVLTIILDNSIKYTNNGYIEFNINTIIKGDIVRLIISVEDSGIGMKAEDINKIFTKKQEREDNHNLNNNLYNAKRLITLMNGTIVPSSSYGSGTTIKIILDQKYDTIDTDINKYDNIYDKKKVLLIDDSPSSEKLFNKILSGTNIELTSVKLGKEGLEKIRNKEKYDLILLDEELEPQNGHIIMRKLLEIRNFNIKVILLTKDNKYDYDDSYLQEGFTDYIIKSSDKEEMLNKINKYLK